MFILLYRIVLLSLCCFSVGLGTDQVDSFNPPSTLGTNLYQSQSNPDLTSISYDDARCDYPEHVLKVIMVFQYFLSFIYMPVSQ